MIASTRGLCQLTERMIPWSCPLFISRDSGLAIVSITSISIGAASDRLHFIVSHASMRLIISNAVIR
jgi:hypothetical protein